MAWKPASYNSLSPYLLAEEAEPVVAFLEKAFGAEVLRRLDHPDGTAMHVDMRVDDTVVMIGGARGRFQPVPSHVPLYVKDAEAAFRSAVEAGGEPVVEPTRREDDPDLRGAVHDPGGNTWWIATQGDG